MRFRAGENSWSSFSSCGPRNLWITRLFNRDRFSQSLCLHSTVWTARLTTCLSYLLRSDSCTRCVSSPLPVTLSLSVKINNTFDSNFVRGSSNDAHFGVGVKRYHFLTCTRLPSQLVVQAYKGNWYCSPRHWANEQHSEGMCYARDWSSATAST